MAFVPTVTRGLTGWCFSDLGLADGTALTTVPALAAGSANTLTKHGTVVYKTNIVNGKGVARFTATDGWASMASALALSGDFSIFIVHQTSGDSYLMGHSTLGWQCRVGQSGGNILSMFDPDAGLNPQSDTLAAARTVWNIAEYHRINGNVVAFNEAGTSRNVAGTGSSQGRFDGATVPTFDQIGNTQGNPLLAGDIGLVLVYNLATGAGLTETERAAVYNDILAYYAITSAILPTTVVRASTPSAPKIYSLFHYQNAAGVNFRNLTIDVRKPYGSVYPFTDADTPDLATFQAAAATKIPSVSTAGRGYLNCEVAPSLTPGTAALYADAAWTGTGFPLITSMLDWARTQYPNIKWGVYKWPLNAGLDGYTHRTTDWANTKAAVDWYDATGFGTYSWAQLLTHCDEIQPEMFGWQFKTADLSHTFTQEEWNAWARWIVQTARDLNNYRSTQVDRPVNLWLWPQYLATGSGGGTVDTFVSLDKLTLMLTAARQSGADGIYLGGGAGGSITADEWQAWADTDLRTAMTQAGYIRSPDRRSRLRRR